MQVELSSLSNDITILTAEINSYKQVAGQSIFEIGKRLKKVRDTKMAEKYGGWYTWVKEVEIAPQTATRLIQAYEQFGERTASYGIPIGKIFEMLSLPKNIDRHSFIETIHTIPTTGEKKSVDDMTLKELREVKKALKEAEKQRELAERDAQILRDTLESIEDKEPEVEYIKVNDEATEQKLRKYEELFGDVSMYEGKTTRVTNGDAITYSVFEFTEDVRKFVEKYGHLTHFAKEFNGMISEGKAEYSKAIQSMFSLLKSMERNLTEEVIIING